MLRKYLIFVLVAALPVAAYALLTHYQVQQQRGEALGRLLKETEAFQQQVNGFAEGQHGLVAAAPLPHPDVPDYAQALATLQHDISQLRGALSALPAAPTAAALELHSGQLAHLQQQHHHLTRSIPLVTDLFERLITLEQSNSRFRLYLNEGAQSQDSLFVRLQRVSLQADSLQRLNQQLSREHAFLRSRQQKQETLIQTLRSLNADLEAELKALREGDQ